MDKIFIISAHKYNMWKIIDMRRLLYKNDIIIQQI